jgi:multiple antibiotic resistance protein
MIHSLIAFGVGTLVALFPIANPLGAIPVFYSLTVADTRQYRLKQAKRTAVNVVLVLTIFFLLGKLILNFFGLSLPVLSISGGLIIGHTAWEMVTVRQRITLAEHQAAIDQDDISFTPMAVPMVSGPGAIGIMIGLSTKAHQWSDYAGCVIGILGLGMILYVCLRLGEPLIERFGETGIGAINRILGFLILAIAVQLIADGILALV